MQAAEYGQQIEIDEIWRIIIAQRLRVYFPLLLKDQRKYISWQSKHFLLDIGTAAGANITAKIKNKKESIFDYNGKE